MSLVACVGRRLDGVLRCWCGTEDTFGADDADWAIYRKIVSTRSHLVRSVQAPSTPTPLQNTAAASSDEEEDFASLQAIEQKLLAHDPTFTEEHTHAALSSQRSALMSAFRPQYEEGDAKGKSRIHLNVERWRVCEAWFSPSMAGVDSAGLGEVLQNVLGRFPDQDKGRLVKVCSPIPALVHLWVVSLSVVCRTYS